MAAGRKSKLNRELIKRAGELATIGGFDNIVYDNLNISKSVYYEWMRKGEQDKEDGKSNLYVELYDTIVNSRSKAELNAIAQIQKAGLSGKWQANAWLLERRFKDNWGKADNELETTVVVNFVPLTKPDDLDLSKYEQTGN